MITRLSHATFFVLSQEKAFDVYVNRLGFKVHTDMTMDNGFRWLTVTAPGAPNHEIILAEPKPPMFEPEDGELVRRLLERNVLGAGVMECDNCQATYEVLKKKGIEFTKEPTKEFYGIEAIFKDGCGNWFSLTERQTNS